MEKIVRKWFEDTLATRKAAHHEGLELHIERELPKLVEALKAARAEEAKQAANAKVPQTGAGQGKLPPLKGKR